MTERYLIRRCPECGGQVEGFSIVSHFGGCPNIPRAFVPEEVSVAWPDTDRGAVAVVEAARRVLREHEITDLEDGGRVYVDALVLAALRDAVRGQ